MSFVLLNQLFLDKAHGVAASSLVVVFIVGVVAQNSMRSGRESGAYRSKDEALKKQKKNNDLSMSYLRHRYFFGNRYSLIAWLMIGSAVVLIVAGLGFGWSCWILAVEIAEIALFATFWLIQTFDPQGNMVPLGDDLAASTPAGGQMADTVDAP